MHVVITVPVDIDLIDWFLSLSLRFYDIVDIPRDILSKMVNDIENR